VPEEALLPLEPEVPALPVEPEVAELPERPDTPIKPDEPEEPELPDDLAKPALPVEPEVAELPEEPERAEYLKNQNYHLNLNYLSCRDSRSLKEPELPELRLKDLYLYQMKQMNLS
jgi:hypothetical protein